jgi:excisionase family DNA binding protein
MLTTAEVGARLGLSTRSVTAMVQRGLIRAVRLHDQGRIRISETALGEFIAAREAAASCRCGRKGGCA